MRRLTAGEDVRLWHKEKSQLNGCYLTFCGLLYGMAGSLEKKDVPAGACARCLKYWERSLDAK